VGVPFIGREGALGCAGGESSVEGSGRQGGRPGTRRQHQESRGRWTSHKGGPTLSHDRYEGEGGDGQSRRSRGTRTSSDGWLEGSPEENGGASEGESSSSDEDEHGGFASLRLAVLEARLRAPPPDDGDRGGGGGSGSGGDEDGGGRASGGARSGGSGGAAAAKGGRRDRRCSTGAGAVTGHGDGGGPAVGPEERRRLAELRSGDPEFFAEVVQLARLVAGSSHVVCFTGAGISTGKGADLPTIRGKFGLSAAQLKEDEFDPASVQRLAPTRAHMALVALHRAGYVRYVCTQNIENLHRLSGLPDDALWEAHGNLCGAHCPNCGQQYTAPPASKMCGACWDPSKAQSHNVRRSWRTGMLKRSVLSHYGAKVDVPEAARAHCGAADLALILGTSLSVQPFAKYAQRPRHLAIVNLEKTRAEDAEKRARKKNGARLLRSCDDVLDALLLLLGVPPAPPLAPGTSNLPAFLEHGEETVDVAAIFMGGRKAYARPRGPGDGTARGRGRPRNGQERSVEGKEAEEVDEDEDDDEVDSADAPATGALRGSSDEELGVVTALGSDGGYSEGESTSDCEDEVILLNNDDDVSDSDRTPRLLHSPASHGSCSRSRGSSLSRGSRSSSRRSSGGSSTSWDASRDRMDGSAGVVVSARRGGVRTSPRGAAASAAAQRNTHANPRSPQELASPFQSFVRAVLPWS